MKTMKLSEVIQKTITLAHEIQAYWEEELPKRHPNYPLVNAGEDSGPPPPQELELKKFLQKQPPEFLYRLALVMFLGRGDFSATQVAEHYASVKERMGKREFAAGQVFEQASLDAHLSDGLEELRKNGMDVDDLPLQPALSRK